MKATRPDVRDEAIRAEAVAWCERLAYDRAQASWSIRFTQREIDATHATKLAWQAHCVVRDRLGRDTARQLLWTEAAKLLRAGWGSSPKGPKAPRAETPKSLPKPVPPPPLEEPIRMAKKQTRRSISVSKATYERAGAFAKSKGISLSQLTETALVHALEHFFQNETETT